MKRRVIVKKKKRPEDMPAGIQEVEMNWRVRTVKTSEGKVDETKGEPSTEVTARKEFRRAVKEMFSVVDLEESIGGHWMLRERWSNGRLSK